jgi:hypothetical protein
MRSLAKYSLLGLTAIGLHSALIFMGTATSEDLLAPLAGCFSLVGAVITVLHSCLALYFEPLIVYILSSLVEIPL